MLAKGDRVKDNIDELIARCDREIERIEKEPPTEAVWLTVLGIEDWRMEKRILEALRESNA